MKAKKIKSFTEDYHFLSNSGWYTFYDKNGHLYFSVEHYYQSMKTKDKELRNKIRNAISPTIAYNLGKTVELRKDWEDIKIQVMKQALRYKFWQNSTIRKGLMFTEGIKLINENDSDTIWGTCNGKGKNLLGKYLMQLRDEYLEINKTHDMYFEWFELNYKIKSNEGLGLFKKQQNPILDELRKEINNIFNKYSNKTNKEEIKQLINSFGIELLLKR